MKRFFPFTLIQFAFALLFLTCLLSLLACGTTEKDDPTGSSETSQQETMWLGHVLVHRNGAPVVERVDKPLEVITLKPGDVVKAIGATPVSTPMEVQEQFNQVGAGEKVLLVTQRGDMTRAAIITRPDSLETPGPESLETSSAEEEGTR